MKKAKKKSLNIGVSRYLLPSPFGEGLGVRLFVLLLLVVGVGQGAHAQYVITKETARCLTKQDSLLSDNFGQKVDGQLKSPYRADTVSLIDKYFRRGMSRKGILMIPKGKRPAPETYLKRRYIRRIGD